MSGINFEIPPQTAVEKHWFTEQRQTRLRDGQCQGWLPVCGGHTDQNEAIKCYEQQINNSKKMAVKEPAYKEEMSKFKIELRIVRYDMIIEEDAKEITL
jgi:hypothetical protein